MVTKHLSMERRHQGEERFLVLLFEEQKYNDSPISPPIRRNCAAFSLYEYGSALAASRSSRKKVARKAERRFDGETTENAS